MTQEKNRLGDSNVGDTIHLEDASDVKMGVGEEVELQTQNNAAVAMLEKRIVRKVQSTQAYKVPCLWLTTLSVRYMGPSFGLGAIHSLIPRPWQYWERKDGGCTKRPRIR